MGVSPIFLFTAYIVTARLDATSSGIASLEEDNNLNALQDGAQCITGFDYYEGWCVATSGQQAFSYDDSVKFCRQKGAFAPSIQSQADLDFWSKYASTIGHFWTDAYCPSNGQKYLWRDGTPTVFMGPKSELKSCQTEFGYHVHPDGFEKYGYGTPAPAVCVLSPQLPEPIPTDNYCACTPNSIYLDIVFIIDTSDDMNKKTVSDVTATIQSVLYSLTFGSNVYQANVAALAYSDTVKVVKSFGNITSSRDISSFELPFLGGETTKMTDAVLQATSMISAKGRSYTRGVILLLTKSINELEATKINEAVDAFKNDGGIFISIDYATGGSIKGLKDIASPGFYLHDVEGNKDMLTPDIIYALCDANCFCPNGLHPYNVPNEKGRELPQGCYHISDSAAVYEAADQNCQRQSGYVATAHDADKNFFLLSIFPMKTRYWLGLRVDGTRLQWADKSSNKWASWATNNPVNGQNCVYAKQATGFDIEWYSAPCTDPLKNSMTYACQLRPCDSEYDCWN